MPFVWNKAQEYLHARIEDQLRRTGKVRIFVLKGRQQGISTYIAARFYHKATRQVGKRVFILSHHSTTTGVLFQIVERYHSGAPIELTPSQEKSNQRQLVFDNRSQYTVGTAGTGDIARGDTNHYMHWSEVAFSENIDGLLSGVCQTVADVQGTEKIYESTANGVGNFFYRGCIDALSGDDEYELVFIPWYWQEEYRAKVKESFSPTEEEFDLKRIYGLDDEQLQWRRNKIREFDKNTDGVKLFKQEYPCSVKEAFQSSGEQLVDPDAVQAARKSGIKDTYAPKILGVDPGPVNDPTTFAFRQGRQLHWVRKRRKMSPMQLAGTIVQYINRYGLDKVFVDMAEGRGAVDRCRELGYGDIVIGIPFSMRPIDEQIFVNKRAEMAGEVKQWLEDEGGVGIPDDAAQGDTVSGDEIEVAIGAIPPFEITSNGKFKLRAKEDIKKDFGSSTDVFDGIMLTFAQKVRNTYNDDKHVNKAVKTRKSELSAVNRRQSGRRSTSNMEYEDKPGWNRTNPKFRRP